MSKSLKSDNEITFNDWDEKKEILSEWSTEINTSLETLRNERTKIYRHINHLFFRIKFLEESFENSHFTEECLKKTSNLQLELSSIDKEILSKKELQHHINT